MSDLPVELGMLDGPQRRYSRSLGGDPENREWQSGLRDWLQSGDEAPLFDEADALAAEELFGDDAMDADDSLDYPVERKKVSKLPSPRAAQMTIVQRHLVYLKYWTLNLRPLMFYPKASFPLNFIIKAMQPSNLSLRQLRLSVLHDMEAEHRAERRQHSWVPL